MDYSKKRSEYSEQVSVFLWAAMYESMYPDLWLMSGSIMGGTKIPFKILAKWKKSGMKKGKPDIQLPVARGGYIGLWIELKQAGGRDPSSDQVEYLTKLAKAGHYACCCKGSEAAIQTIKRYVNGKIIKGGAQDGIFDERQNGFHAY